jgi:membrane dipeptidase
LRSYAPGTDQSSLGEKPKDLTGHLIVQAVGKDQAGLDKHHQKFCNTFTSIKPAFMKGILLLNGLFFMLQAVNAQGWRKLHHKAIVADTHNDVLSQAVLEGLPMDADLRGRAHSDLERWRSGGVDVQVFSVFCNETFGMGTAFKQALRQIDSLYATISRNPGRMMMVTNTAELKEAVRQKKLGCMIGVEGGHMIEDRMDYLDSLYRLGARYMTLTWNNSTSWASSAKDEWAPPEPGKPAISKGLNDLGKQIVRRMNQLGMLVDLSHVGEATFWDAIAVTTKPVLVSHSCVYNLCPHSRNLKDEQIKAVAKNGGVIHLNFYSGFVDSAYMRRQREFQQRHGAEADSLKNLQWPGYKVNEWMAKKYPAEAEAMRAPLSMLLNHLDYIVQLTGSVNHVGLGSDFDGIESPPQQLDDVSCFPVITRELLKRGYSKKSIRKILGGNFIRLLRANEGR